MSCQLLSTKRYMRNFMLLTMQNAKCNGPENKDNKLYEIEPVLDHVREN